MLILRLAAVLVVIALVVGLAAFLFTGNRRYLEFSWRVLGFGVVAGLILFALLAAERLLVLPL